MFLDRFSKISLIDLLVFSPTLSGFEFVEVVVKNQLRFVLVESMYGNNRNSNFNRFSNFMLRAIWIKDGPTALAYRYNYPIILNHYVVVLWRYQLTSCQIKYTFLLYFIVSSVD